MDKWIFSLKLRNSAGVLSALTALFADRGVSIESLTAHGGMGTAGGHGTAVLIFAASEARKTHLARLLGRLASVLEVTEYRYGDAHSARKSVLARVSLPEGALTARLPPGVLCDIVSADDGHTAALLLGPPLVLDTLLTQLAADGAVEEMDSAVTLV